jgi:K+-sensing histidine kinase KdpD
MQKVTNNSIGIGLSCSRDIITAMGGKIRLKHSEKGFTIFNVRVPIEIENPGVIFEESLAEHAIQKNKHFIY